MKTKAIMITAGIFGSISYILGKIGHSISSIWFSIFAIILFLLALFVHKGEIKEEKESTNRKTSTTGSSFGADDQQAMVIKSISNEKDGFKTIEDIAIDTNLPIKTIKKAINWLYMHNFVSIKKGLNGEAFILTSIGRQTFAQRIGN